MELSRKRSRVLRGATGLLATALFATASLPLTAGAAHAEPVSRSLPYLCTMPLVGARPATAVFEVDVPTGIVTGEPVTIGVDGELTLDATTSQAMRIVNAVTLEGSAVAHLTVEAPEGSLPLDVPLTLPSADVPPGPPYVPTVIPIDGGSAEVIFTEPGPASLIAGSLTLTLTPRQADWSLTGLGTFQSECALQAGQDNVLATFEIGPGDPGPQPGDVTLSYECALPLIGRQPVTATFRPEGPATVEVGRPVSFGAGVSATFDDEMTHQMFRMVNATTVDAAGTAALAVDGPRRDDFASLGSLNLDRIVLPPGPPYTALGTDGRLSATDVTFARRGPGEVSVGALILTMVASRADGTLSGLGVFGVPCTQDPDQDNVLTAFDVVRATGA
ncbi:DUF6801 domain-containing protein [Streptomyces sp. NBC_01803]|uniref:DUF6801 domain-containing protein n=1 Tax=Streptomyces sp. NBC_01803 TaxID=2975946 RepID=UPI002DD8C720|nr:DUF6801 domain-containing protein [Streptomyces sp. NBC_01803]WSA43602.1 hypothetical protein OIE51_04920 [Streptomyces sp. NBC_01803]